MHAMQQMSERFLLFEVVLVDDWVSSLMASLAEVTADATNRPKAMGILKWHSDSSMLLTRVLMHGLAVRPL